MDRAARFRAQLAWRAGDAGLDLEIEGLGFRQLHEIHARRHHVKLEIGILEFRPRFHEGHRVGHREAQQALAAQRVFEDLSAQLRAVGELVHGAHLSLEAPLHADHVMVLHVLTHARQLMHHGDAVL
jgi:hypothetical protein